MSKELFVSTSPHETKVAVLEDDQLVEVYFERDTNVGLVGGIYKGRVSRVLPGMQSAFVDIGLERDAFLYVSDFFLEDQEEYDKIFEEAEARVGRGGSEGASALAPLSPQSARPASEPSAETAAAPPSPEAPQAPSPGGDFSQAAPTPPDAPSPAAPASVAPAVPSPVPTAGVPSRPAPGEGSDYRRSEYGGPRRRRRGRGYGNHRFSPRRDFGPSRTDAPRTGTPVFEVLPGESLAKYNRPGSEATPGAVSAAPVSESEVTEVASPWRSELRTPNPVPHSGSSPAGASTDSSPSESASQTSEPYTEPPSLGRPGKDLAPAPSAAEDHFEHDTESRALPGPVGESFDPAPIGASAAVEPSRNQEVSSWSSSPAEVEIPITGNRAAREGSPLAATEGLAESTPPTFASPIAQVPIPNAMDPGASAAALSSPATAPAGEAPVEGPTPAPPLEGSSAPSERTYTFREPHQRPRFAPRRGRRGPRGAGYRRPAEGRRESPRPGNHQPRPIAELLKEGQEILVQIAKEPLGTKGARITSHIALPGRYVVYMPTINHLGVSRKIASEEERLRLRNIILDNKGSLTGGFIVRTAGGGRSEDELKADLQFLGSVWAEIRAKAEQTKAPALLHRDLDLLQRILRDFLSPDFKSVRVDSEVDYERALDFVSRCQPSLVGAVKLYTRDAPLFDEFGVQAEIEKALKPKVWLKSGGYIVINQTEALVAIDVNTGKYVGKTNRLEDTILKTNIDAVKEIVRQVRLRDLGGIIVIDFIDMDERRNRLKVVQALEEALRHDRAPTKIVSFNDFGLVAITRKRVKQSLERTLCNPCSYCSGAGWIKSTTTVCYEILAEVRKMADEIEGNVLTLRVNPEVAHALKSRDGVLISEIESLTHKDVVIKSDPTVHQERFEIF